MARDLIPPPSPAGRPDREGTHSDAELELDRPPAQKPAEEEQVERVDSPYRSRFGFITGALVGVAMAAVVVVALVVTSGGKSSSETAQWSAWQPTAHDPDLAVAQIAQHVGLEYRLNDGSQLVSVDSGPIQLGDIPLQVVVRTRCKGGDIIPITGNGIWYVMNGLGDRGSIEKGTPSVARGLLVRREAVELALYTFHYLKNVDHVVTLLPPRPASKGTVATGSSSAVGLPQDSTVCTPTADGSQPLNALLFRPGDFKAQLNAPLSDSIPPNTPRPATLSLREQNQLSEVTSNNVFEASVRQSQTGAGFLILDRPKETTSTPLLQPALPTPTPTSTPTATATPKAKKKKG